MTQGWSARVTLSMMIKMTMVIISMETMIMETIVMMLMMKTRMIKMMEDGVVCACYPGYDDYNVYLDGNDDSDDHLVFIINIISKMMDDDTGVVCACYPASDQLSPLPAL